MLDAWRHSGFNVFAGERIQPREKKSLENLDFETDETVNRRIVSLE
jgi:hypothetical protein